MANTVDKVISIAKAEEGYLEKSATAYKKDKTILNKKIEGAGSDNYTKYGRDMHEIYPTVMDFPAAWCDAFVDWCFYKAYGIANAKGLLGGNFDDYTVASAQLYKNKGMLDTNPKKGDQVFFTKNGQVGGCYHTGLVYDVDKVYFYTIEGNTSGASGVISNGGGVARKKYGIASYKGKTIFGHPRYDAECDTTKPAKSVSEVAQEIIKGIGGWGNEPGRSLKLKAAGYNPEDVQNKINSLLQTPTKKTIPALASDTPNLKIGSTGVQVGYLQQDLNYLGFKGKDNKTLSVDKDFGTNTDYALRAFQKKNKLSVDGIYGSKSKAKMKTLLI